LQTGFVLLVSFHICIRLFSHKDWSNLTYLAEHSNLKDVEEECTKQLEAQRAQVSAMQDKYRWVPYVEKRLTERVIKRHREKTFLWVCFRVSFSFSFHI